MKNTEQKSRGRTRSERVPPRTILTPAVVEWKPDVPVEGRDETPPIPQATPVLSPAAQDREAIRWAYRTSPDGWRECVLVVAKLLHALREYKANLLDLVDEIGERAAIMEFDGGLSRAEAERLAVADLLPHGAPGDNGRKILPVVSPPADVPDLDGLLDALSDADDMPQDSGWLERTDEHGRREWVRGDVADLELHDLPDACAVCGSLERWQDAAGGWHCQRCEPPWRQRG